MDSHAKTETLLDEEFQCLPGVLQVNPDENVESLVDQLTQRSTPPTFLVHITRPLV